jgi:hypothetical protein
VSLFGLLAFFAPERIPLNLVPERIIAAELVQTQEACIAALERLVGKLVLENDFLKGASRDAPRPRSETMPVITGPVASRSQKDAG